ncbi:MAG: hypothetical protein LBG43_04375 [Treponema sp.]|jgi:uncharacterized membrane protein|nr:hypothetical protein [Treponema sp.]
MKRIFVVLLAFIVSVGLYAQTAADFETKTNGNGSLAITKYVGKNTYVLIPAQINGKRVTEIGGKSVCRR